MKRFALTCTTTILLAAMACRSAPSSPEWLEGIDGLTADVSFAYEGAPDMQLVARYTVTNGTETHRRLNVLAFAPVVVELLRRADSAVVYRGPVAGGTRLGEEIVVRAGSSVTLARTIPSAELSVLPDGEYLLRAEFSSSGGRLPAYSNVLTLPIGGPR